MKLMREIRTFVGRDGEGATLPVDDERCFPGLGEPTPRAWGNTWAGTRAGPSLGTFWSLRAVVEGPIDPQCGYICDIKLIDACLRNHALPVLEAKIPTRSPVTLASLSHACQMALKGAREHLPNPTKVTGLELRLSPHTMIRAFAGDPPMVELTHSYEFSASHRLCREGLSDEENRRLFGKCSNPNGHGHNYMVEVTVTGLSKGDIESTPDLAELDQSVLRWVIEPFDHKNLNIEVSEFASMNPTVENIARVIWNRLEDTFSSCKLTRIRVWETPRTYAEYQGK